MRAWLKALWAKELARCAALFTFIMVNNVGTFWFLYWRLRTKSAQWPHDRLGALEFDVQEVCLGAHPGADVLCARLTEQQEVAIVRGMFHADLFSHYISEHFAALSMTFACSIFVAASLTYIVRKGWDNSHNYMNTSFIAFAICVAFFGGYPQLAQHNDNVKENELLMLKHGNLVNGIRSFAATGVAKMEGEQEPVTDLADFIHHVDKELVEMNHIPLEFDASAVDVGSSKFIEMQPE